MKVKVLAIVLLSAVICLAQTSNQNGPSTSKTQTTENGAAPKASCPCCHAMAEKKDAKPCCHHDSAANDSNKMMCCDRKEAMSCMKDDEAKSAESCCGNSDQKACCTKSDKPSAQTAMACCGGSEGHCGMQAHNHADLSQ